MNFPINLEILWFLWYELGVKGERGTGFLSLSYGCICHALETEIIGGLFGCWCGSCSIYLYSHCISEQENIKERPSSWELWLYCLCTIMCYGPPWNATNTEDCIIEGLEKGLGYKKHQLQYRSTGSTRIDRNGQNKWILYWIVISNWILRVIVLFSVSQYNAQEEHLCRP
jgi:hypothetical protein